ncbi:MAG: hypothetical protein KGM43_15900 [Planctomycetota bacterium]|nr:hypothetical protein [Planctomycetota bacterium]
MSIIYNIYSNNNSGGAVNYAAPIASTAALSFTTSTLPPGSDTTFAIRAQDTATGLEEANTIVVRRVILDANGNDVSAQPNAPHALQAAPTAGGGCSVSWAYQSQGQGAPPNGFYVYSTAGSTPNYAAPAATVPYSTTAAGFQCEVNGLVDGQIYAVAVRAFNAVATESNTVAVSVTGDLTPPANVDLFSVATF